MALSNTIDKEKAADILANWLGQRMPEATGIRVTDVTVPSSSGLSTETLLFTSSWTGADGSSQSVGMVARVQPEGPGVFPSYDLEKEALVIRALADHTDVPAPELLFYESDAGFLGAPFLVMARVDGQIPSDDPPFTAAGWVLDLTPEQRAGMWQKSLAVIAKIHAVDWRTLGLASLDTPENNSGLDAQLAYWQRTFAWATEGDANPTIERGLQWLTENKPAESEKVLNWGDARVGNLIFGADLSVAAVLDWEMVGLASPEVELGWWLFLMRHHTEGIGMALPEGIPNAQETVAAYEEISGRTVRNIGYYEIFAGVRLSIIMVRAAHMMIGLGFLPADSTMALNNPASQLTAQLLQLDAPSGDAVSFIGNR